LDGSRLRHHHLTRNSSSSALHYICARGTTSATTITCRSSFHHKTVGCSWPPALVHLIIGILKFRHNLTRGNTLPELNREVNWLPWSFILLLDHPDKCSFITKYLIFYRYLCSLFDRGIVDNLSCGNFKKAKAFIDHIKMSGLEL
jgi:hypothetical protein